MNYIYNIKNKLNPQSKLNKPEWIDNKIYLNCIKNNISFDTSCKECGYGTYSKVYTVIYDNNYVSLKILNNKNIKSQIINEINSLKILNHKNIIKYIKDINQNDDVYILTEYADCGELFYLIGDYLSESECKYYMKGITDGLKYMHDNKIIHRDIKLENILVKNEIDKETNLIVKVPKLADFGFSIIQEENMITGVIGTSYYIAPEIISEKNYDGYKSDIFSLGCLLYILKFGNYPFPNRPHLICSISEVYVQIYNIPMNNFPKSIIISDNLKKLINNMLIIDPIKRYSITDVINNEWL